jgi:hypothetical protein
MRQQLCLATNAQVRDLVECPMTADEYIAVLVQAGIIAA